MLVLIFIWKLKKVIKRKFKKKELNWLLIKLKFLSNQNLKYRLNSKWMSDFERFDLTSHCNFLCDNATSESTDACVVYRRFFYTLWSDVDISCLPKTEGYSEGAIPTKMLNAKISTLYSLYVGYIWNSLRKHFLFHRRHASYGWFQNL